MNKKERENKNDIVRKKKKQFCANSRKYESLVHETCASVILEVIHIALQMLNV